ncbi:MAG: 5'/3'-nucleotidase SurE [Haloarculaceae archaeon]
MSDRILLTNDDGIDAPGLRALHDALSTIGDVTVVAPWTNQSAVGRSLSYGRVGMEAEDVEYSEADRPSLADERFSCRIPHDDHDLGYAVRGTPCDCVILGVNAFERPDIVVSGCNPGANVGAFVLSRSGTASAAMEGALLDVPSMAVSMDTLGMGRDPEVADFERAAALTVDLVEHTLSTDVFDHVDYLNVNAPRPDREMAGVAVTEPTPVYEMDAHYEDGEFHLHNRLWEQMASGDLPDPPGTDRRALAAGKASVSPLTVPHAVQHHDALDAFAETA